MRNQSVGRLFAAVGGMFVGMISVGLARLEEYELVVRCRMPPPVAVATSVFVVVITVLVAALGHGYALLHEADTAALEQLLSIATFTIPGVLIGGQIGPRVGSHLDPEHLKTATSMLFMAIGAFMLFTVTLY